MTLLTAIGRRLPCTTDSRLSRRERGDLLKFRTVRVRGLSHAHRETPGPLPFFFVEAPRSPLPAKGRRRPSSTGYAGQGAATTTAHAASNFLTQQNQQDRPGRKASCAMAEAERGMMIRRRAPVLRVARSGAATCGEAPAWPKKTLAVFTDLQGGGFALSPHVPPARFPPLEAFGRRPLGARGTVDHRAGIRNPLHRWKHSLPCAGTAKRSGGGHQSCFSASPDAGAFVPGLAAASAGSVISNRAPPSAPDVADRSPSCCSTIILQIARPNPVPLAFVVTNASKMLVSFSGQFQDPCLPVKWQLTWNRNARLRR